MNTEHHPRHAIRGIARAVLACAVFASLAGAAPAIGAGYRDEVLADGPSAYWRLGEPAGATVAASAVPGNGGTYAGGVTLGQAGALSGDADTAAAFDGVNDAVTVPASGALDATTGVTVELWAKRTKNGAYQVVVGKPGSGQSRLENYAVWFDTSNRVQAYFGNGTSHVSVGWGRALDNNWHHIVATYDNAVARMYVDGVQRAQKQSSIALTPVAGDLNIGRSAAGTYFFGGVLDEVAVYRQALSAARVQAHFAAAPVPAVDDVPPALTLGTPADGSVAADPTPTLSGVAGTATGDAASVTVRLVAGTDIAAPAVQTLGATRGPSGAYTVDAAALADGTYTAQATQTDAAGNTGTSAATTFTVDATAPTVTLTRPATGTTAGAPPTFGGTAGTHLGDASSVTVRVYSGTSADGTPVQTLTAARGLVDGAYEVTADTLADGTYSARTAQTDLAGNTGLSDAVTFTVDATAPAPTIVQPAAGALIGSQPVFAGTAGAAPGDDGSVTVDVFAGADAAGPPAQTLTAPVADGAWTATPTTPLTDGTWTARVTQSDAAGNAGTSTPHTFALDTSGRDIIRPVISLDTPPSGSATATASPLFGGTAGVDATDSPDVTVRVYAGDSATGTALQTLTTTRDPVDGRYGVAPAALADGVYSAQATQVDAAGNTGQSAATTVTIDTVAPTPAIGQPADGAGIATQPTITGTAGTAAGDGTAISIRVYDGTTTSGAPEQTLSATATDGTWTATPSPALADGTYTVQATQSDHAGNAGQSQARTFTVDTAAPAVNITQPAGGATVATATPDIAGQAGTLAGDGTAVTVRIFPGSVATGTPAQTLNATRDGAGAFTVTAAALANGTYTATARQSDAAGNTGTSQAVTFTVAVASADPVMIGAGDIAGCGSSTEDHKTAAILAQHPDATVFTLGDNAYDNGTAANYANCYDPTWGAHKSRTRPIIGDHDLDTGTPSAYLNYFNAQLTPFGPTATDPTKMYYSYNLGAWHVVALNGVCFYYTPGCDPAAQEAWLRADLAANPNVCTMVLMSSPRFSSGNIHGNNPDMQGLWAAAYEGGAELVLSGDDHVYERFAPMDAAGAADPAYGLRQFVVGTGGYMLYGFGTPHANSQVRYASSFGVIKLTLHPTAYSWEFLPVDGLPSPDSGTTNCHGVPPPPGTVEGSPTVRATSTATANYASTSLTIPTPAGTVAGDVMVATVGHQGGSSRTITAPAGWTPINGADGSDGSNVRLRGFFKVATGSEPASHVFTLTGGSGMSIAGGIMSITGARTVNPVDVAATQVTSSNSATLTAPSVTTTVAKTMLIYAGAVNSTQTFTPPDGMVERWDVKTSGSYNVAAEAATAGFAGPGATGTRAARTAQTARGVAMLIAIAPPAS